MRRLFRGALIVVSLTFAFVAEPFQTARAQALPDAKAASPRRGAFLTPVSASATSAQTDAGRTAQRLIDGSGWGEDPPFSGTYLHTSNVFAGGANMWNGEPRSVLTFDLGRSCRTDGVYVWNYNEANGYNSRSVKDVDITGSVDGVSFAPVGSYTFTRAPGRDDYSGELVPFGKTVTARYFRFAIRSNYGGDNAGLAEIRFSDADHKFTATRPEPWTPRYPRPSHPLLDLHRALAGAENVVYPADAGLVDVTRSPYGAKGDGRADDTAALQRALTDNADNGSILYLPNGTYRVTDQLRWGHNERNTILQGQSREGTIIQLDDHCPGFTNPRRPRGVIWTGERPAQRFSNELHNLTIDTGSGNPGACGLQFIANNQGGVYDLTIVSGDGQGQIGLDLGYTDEQGPCLIKNAKVVGFDIGVHTASSVASVTMEHIRVERQNLFGVRNDGQPCTIRDLQSLNAVPALAAAGGLTTLVEASLRGTGAATSRNAIDFLGGALTARDVRTTGYAAALRDLRSGVGTQTAVTGPNFAQWTSRPAVRLFGKTAGSGLRLPIRETPNVPWGDIRTWVRPRRTSADGTDDSPSIQRAIDSGAETVYLPHATYHIGSTIVLRGRVHRLLGCTAYLETTPTFQKTEQPVFRFTDGPAPIVVIEGLRTDFSSGAHYFLEHSASRTLVMRRLAINFQGADAYQNSGAGDLFIEDVVGRYFRHHRQRVWARQYNVEGDGLHVLNEGGTLWILGLKTEGGGTLLDTRAGGVSEILGGFSYTVGAKLPQPMFAIDGTSQASFTFSEVCYDGGPFATVVHETGGNVSLDMLHDDSRWQSCFTLFSSGK